MRAAGRILVGGAAIAAGIAIARAVQRSRNQGVRVRGRGDVFVANSIAARNARLALIGAKTGTRHLAHRARLATASEDARADLEAAHQLRSAAEVAEVLGELKGGLMKVGQMVSYLDDGLPQPVRDALASLQQDAPPMAPELCNEVVRTELGDVPTRVFAEWDPIPLAAASIGQVHRAVTRNGVRVAVKVQYPGVDEAIRADLANTDFLFRALGLLFPGLDPKPLVEELRARIVEELDYRVEADNQQLFADYYEGHPFIHVPEVLREFSTSRVLTTELAVGSRFSDVERWSQDERDAAAESIFRFVFRSIYRLGAFNGDPHPGNYLFMPGGRVTFLDFGLVKRYTAEEVAMFESLIRAFVIERDIPKFRRELVNYDVLRESDISDDDVRQYFGHFYEFVMDDRELEFTPEFASETIRHMFDPSSPYAHVARSSNVPPAFVITQRINLGLHALLGRLRARRNWRRIAFELWPFTHGEPSTPLGELEAAWLESRRARMKSEQLVFTAVGRCESEAVEVDENIRSTEVLIRNQLGLISPGTELAIFTGEHRGFEMPDHWAKYPWWPGYCNVGEIVAVGRGVFGLEVGDRVVHESTHATFARQHSASVVKLPADITDERAVFFKLAGIAATPQMVSPVGFGERAAVIGQGMVGNLAAELCRAAGVWSVVGIDPAVHRRAVAEACGVDARASLADVADPLPYVIEAVGLGATVRDAMRATAPGGRTIILSSPREKVEIDPYFDIHHPSKQVIGTHESARDRAQRRPYDAYLLDLLGSGALVVDPFVTHRMPFGAELQRAYEGLRDDPNTWMGVLIEYEIPFSV